MGLSNLAIGALVLAVTVIVLAVLIHKDIIKIPDSLNKVTVTVTDPTVPPAATAPPAPVVPPKPVYPTTCRSDQNDGKCHLLGNDQFVAKLLDSGDFVLTKNDKVVWNSKTSNLAGKPANNFYLQGDGHFCMYNGANQAIWCSGIWGRGIGPYTMTLQPDGNLLETDSRGTVIWQSRTDIRFPASY